MSRGARAAAALLLLTACAGRERPRTLRVVTQSPVVTTSPQATDDATTLAVLANVYESLVAFDASGRVLPELAASWSNPAEDLWRFELRPGVRLHDGRSLRATEVAELLLDGLRSSESWLRPLLPTVAHVRAVGERALEIQTHGPAPLLLNHLATVMIALPASTAGLPVGTGPYRIASHGAGATTLSRFDGYWGNPPEWQEAVFASEADGRRRVDAVLRAQADLAEDPPFEDLARLLAGARLIRHRTARLAVLGFDVTARRDNPFADPLVRRAVAVALDRDELVEGALGGWAEPAAQLAPPGVFGFVHRLGADAARPEQARAALAASRHPDGFERPLYFSGERNGELARAVAAQMAAVGIVLQPTARGSAEMDELLLAQGAPAFVVHMTFPNRDSSDLLAWGLHSRDPARRYGVLNFSGFADPELDRLVQLSDATLDPRERYALLEQAMERAMQARAWIPLCIPHRLYAAREGLSWERAATGRVRLAEIRSAE